MVILDMELSTLPDHNRGMEIGITVCIFDFAIEALFIE